MRTQQEQEMRDAERARQRAKLESERELRGDGRDDIVIPVVEEELRVAKREVDAGGVRVSTHVREVPIEKTVTIREERVTIERNVVDRTVDPRDEAFLDRAFDMEATSEEPVITKRAHVVEEIRIHKDRTERVERINDTLRHTDVQVSSLPAERAFDVSPYKTHFEREYGPGYEIRDLAPAYEFGERVYRTTGPGGDWTIAEVDARATWEERQPGTWDRFREAIRAGWARAAGRKA